MMAPLSFCTRKVWKEEGKFLPLQSKETRNAKNGEYYI